MKPGGTILLFWFACEKPLPKILCLTSSEKAENGYRNKTLINLICIARLLFDLGVIGASIQSISKISDFICKVILNFITFRIKFLDDLFYPVCGELLVYLLGTFLGNFHYAEQWIWPICFYYEGYKSTKNWLKMML